MRPLSLLRARSTWACRSAHYLHSPFKEQIAETNKTGTKDDGGKKQNAEHEMPKRTNEGDLEEATFLGTLKGEDGVKGVAPDFHGADGGQLLDGELLQITRRAFSLTLQLLFTKVGVCRLSNRRSASMKT